MISIMAIDGRRKVAGGVKRRAVGAEDDAGGHVVLAQINDRRALGDGQQVLFLQLVDNAIHLVVIERLARIGVERNAQQLIDALGVAEGERLEPVENAQSFLVAILNLLEPRAALIVQRGIFLGFLVELDVQANQFVHAAFLHFFLIAPELIGADHLAKLRSPVAQMVDADGLVAKEIIDAAQTVTNHCGGQMPDMETFGDIDRGIVKTNRLAVAHVGRAIVFSRLEHAFKRFRREIDAVEEEVHIAVDGLCTRNVLMRPLFDHGRGDFRRCHPQCLRQTEHRQRVVTHFGSGGTASRPRISSAVSSPCASGHVSVKHCAISPASFVFISIKFITPYTLCFDFQRLSYHIFARGARVHLNPRTGRRYPCGTYRPPASSAHVNASHPPWNARRLY